MVYQQRIQKQRPFHPQKHQPFARARWPKMYLRKPSSPFLPPSSLISAWVYVPISKLVLRQLETRCQLGIEECQKERSCEKRAESQEAAKGRTIAWAHCLSICIAWGLYDWYSGVDWYFLDAHTKKYRMGENIIPCIPYQSMTVNACLLLIVLCERVLIQSQWTATRNDSQLQSGKRQSRSQEEGEMLWRKMEWGWMPLVSPIFSFVCHGGFDRGLR